MSAYTTLHISRSRAQTYVVQHLFDANDDDLAEALEIFIRHRLFNARIVPDGAAKNDDIEL